MIGTKNYMGVFISTDGGLTWTQVRIRTDENSQACAAAFDPSNTRTIYVAGTTSSGSPVLHKSTDGGANWTSLSPPSSGCPIDALAQAAGSSGPLYAATGWEGIFASTDGGGSWTKFANAPYSGDCLAVNKLNPNELFVGNWNGLWYSADKGATWTDLSGDLPVKSVNSIQVDGAVRKVYVGTAGGGICRRSF